MVTISRSLVDHRKVMFPARYASRDDSYDGRTSRRAVFSMVARTTPIVRTGNGHVLFAGRAYLPKTVRNSSAATAANSLRRALNVAVGWRSGWVGTAASWDAQVFQPATTPGTFAKSHGTKMPTEDLIPMCEQADSLIVDVAATLSQACVK